MILLFVASSYSSSWCCGFHLQTYQILSLTWQCLCSDWTAEVAEREAGEQEERAAGWKEERWAIWLCGIFGIWGILGSWEEGTRLKGREVNLFNFVVYPNLNLGIHPDFCLILIIGRRQFRSRCCLWTAVIQCWQTSLLCRAGMPLPSSPFLMSCSFQHSVILKQKIL